MQVQQTPAAKLSSRYIALEEGFRQFSNDLSKLQVCEAGLLFLWSANQVEQFIEINQTAFSKILKKV